MNQRDKVFYMCNNSDMCLLCETPTGLVYYCLFFIDVQPLTRLGKRFVFERFIKMPTFSMGIFY